MELLLLPFGFLNIFLSFFVLYARHKDRNARLFFIFAVLSGYWVITNFLTGVFPYLFVLRNGYASAVLLASATVVWILYFTETENKKILSLALYATGCIFALIAQFSPFILVNAENITFGGYGSGEVTYGVLFPFFGIYVLGALFFGLFRLYIVFLGSTGTRKKQIKYVLAGLIIYALVSNFVSVILPLFGINKFTLLDSLSSIFFISFTAYAITRYRFMDIRLIIFRTITFGFFIFLVTSLFAAASALIGSIFVELRGFQTDLIVGLIVGLIVSSSYLPIRRFLEKATSRFLFKKSYDPEKLLNTISEIASTTLELDKLTKAVAAELTNALQPGKIGLALLVGSKGELKIYYDQGFKPGEAQALANGQEVNMAKHFEREPGIAVIDEMVTRFEAGEYQPINKDSMYALHEHDVALVIPLYVKDQLRGVLVMGNKKSGDLYVNQDINVLHVISGQLAVALDNARLYDELRQFNITLQKRVDEATEELKDANSKLKVLDQQKSDFISIASHQLRTPLTVIKGYISMINEGNFGKVSAKVSEKLDHVYVSNERLIRLVEDLLNISRIESGRQEFIWAPTKLDALAEEIVGNMQQNALKKNLILEFHKPEKPVSEIKADGGKLHEVMINFVDNAIKYTKAGRIDVYVEEGPKGMVTYKVKDTGGGMTKETREKLFQKFSRGQGSFRTNTEGMGLGLYVAKMIMDAHEGQIWAESAGPGKGSTFGFSVPIAGPKNPPAQPSKSAPFSDGDAPTPTPSVVAAKPPAEKPTPKPRTKSTTPTK